MDRTSDTKQVDKSQQFDRTSLPQIVGNKTMYQKNSQNGLKTLYSSCVDSPFKGQIEDREE